MKTFRMQGNYMCKDAGNFSVIVPNVKDELAAMEVLKKALGDTDFIVHEAIVLEDSQTDESHPTPQTTPLNPP